MDNTHQPPAGDSQDSWPTQELALAGQPGQGPGWGPPSGHAEPPGPAWGPPSGQAEPPGPAWGPPAGQAEPPGPAWGPPSGPAGHQLSGWPGPSSPPPRRGRAVWWGAGLALAAVLAGGGAIAATHLASSNSQLSSGPTGQAAALNTMLNSAGSPASEAAAASFGSSSPGTASSCLNRAAKLKAAGFPGLAQAVLHRCGHPLRRIRLLGGIHGVFTFETKSGPRTLAYERGVIESVSGSDVEVQATDGTLWTWVLQSDTVIRHSGERVTASALSDGEQVFAGGPVVSGAYDARLIVIRPASASSSPSPSPSPAAGS
jgi:hypothetical protein